MKSCFVRLPLSIPDCTIYSALNPLLSCSVPEDLTGINDSKLMRTPAMFEWAELWGYFRHGEQKTSVVSWIVATSCAFIHLVVLWYRLKPLAPLCSFHFGVHSSNCSKGHTISSSVSILHIIDIEVWMTSEEKNSEAVINEFSRTWWMKKTGTPSSFFVEE